MEVVSEERCEVCEREEREGRREGLYSMCEGSRSFAEAVDVWEGEAGQQAAPSSTQQPHVVYPVPRPLLCHLCPLFSVYLLRPA